MANPFYVHPGGDYGQGLQGIAGTMLDVTKQRQERQDKEDKAARYAGVKAGALKAYQSGDPVAMAEFSIANPEMAQAMKSVMGFASDDTEKNYMESLFDIYQNPTDQNAQDLVEARQRILKKHGLPPEKTKETDSFLSRWKSDPEGTKTQIEQELAWRYPDKFLALKKAMGDGSVGQPAEVQTFEYLIEGLSPEDRAKAKRVKLGLDPRASEDAVTKAEKAMAVKIAELQARLNLEPEVAGAVEAAKNEAKSIAETSKTEKSNTLAWDVYDKAMANLSTAMAGAKTGPFVGLIPAITANEQIAEGAVAVMAPVLKQMFRSAGEGIFTDKDQELLMKMVPTRKDTPESRVAKITAIDAIVRAKLGIKDAEKRSENKPVSEMSDDELMELINNE